MKLSARLRNLPLGRKMTLLVLVPCVAVLLVAGGGLVWFQLRLFRADFARDITAVADIVAENSIAAITFRDPADASGILRSLRAKPQIVSAVLVLPDGMVFARYGAYREPPVHSRERRFTYREQDALLIAPVLLEGRQVATLNVVSDYRTVYGSLLKLIAWTLLLMSAVGAGVGFIVSHRLQRLVSAPLLRLAGSAQAVAARGDYSIRAAGEATAELAVLTGAFNRMLDHIERQGGDLRRSQERLAALIDSIDGIVWECAPADLRFTFVSRQSERLIGYPPGRWLERPDFWETIVSPDDLERARMIRRSQARDGGEYTLEYRLRAADGRIVWVRESGAVRQEAGAAVAVRGILLDITREREAAQELERLNRHIVDASRLAGMAEVATGVLHNVGNVLNSVGVSTTLVSDHLQNSKVTNLARATAMLRDHRAELGAYLTDDPKGRLLPEYLATVADQLLAERQLLLQEVTQLARNVDHIKQIVAMQQNYATVAGVFELLDPTTVVEDALRMNAAAVERHRVEVVRDYQAPLPPVRIDRHKVLQILVNLIRNAKYALDAARTDGKRLTVRVEVVGADRVAIRIRDNGVGIPAENVSRIFNHGFTTKKGGHGFGLHSGANAARSMGGRLFAESPGPGQGATFTLELPVAAPAETTEPPR